MDVYSRRIIDWVFQNSIRQMDLITLIKRIYTVHQLQRVILRNDNGSQFMAHWIRNLLKSCQVKQEFTHIATPEETPILWIFIVLWKKKSLNVMNLKANMRPSKSYFFEHYHYHRLHRFIGFITPEKKWEKAMDTIILENMFN